MYVKESHRKRSAHGQGIMEEIKPQITTALESGFECVIVDRENVERVRELGKTRWHALAPRGMQRTFW